VNRSRLVLAGAFVAVVLLTVAAVIAVPRWAPLVAAAGIMVIVAARWPKTFVGAGLLAIVASPTLTNWLEWADYLDEAVIVIAAAVFVTRRLIATRRVVVPAWAWWFAVFVALGLVSALVHSVPAVVMLSGAFLAVKGLVFGLSVAQLDWSPSSVRPFLRGGAVVVVTIFVACLANIPDPVWWASVFHGEAEFFRGELGFASLIGPFVQPAALGRVCALLVVAIIAYQLTVRSSWLQLVLLGMASFGALASFRVKTYVSVIAGVLTVGVLARRSIPRWLIITVAASAVVAAVPLYLFVSHDVYLYVFSESARSRMTLGAVHLAGEYFPWGAGFGRYGSYTASAWYSPEYLRLGFDSVRGLGPGPTQGDYLNDTQWPAIIGEAGFIGGAAFAGGLVHIIVSAVRGRNGAQPALHTWVRLTTVGWLSVMIVESIAAPVFTSPPAYAIPFVAVGVLHSLDRQWRARLESGAQDDRDESSGAEISD
jgi:hypothetical protein